MGQLSDTFNAQLIEMQARHAQTDRQIAVAMKNLRIAINRMDHLAKSLEGRESDLTARTAAHGHD